LVVAVTVAHAFTVLALRRSILTEKVARRGFHVSREYAVDEMEILFVRDVVRRDAVVLAATQDAAAALALAGAHGDEKGQHLFPVLDEGGVLAGAVTHAELRAWAGDPARA